MKFSHALTNSNLLSLLSAHNLRLHLNQLGGRNEPKKKQSVQALQEAAPQDPKGTQNTPQQVADRERQYMELQYIFAQANQRTLADSRPAHSNQTQKPANLLAASQQSTEEAATTVPSKSSTDSKQTQKPASLLAASQQSTEEAASTVPSKSSTDAAAEAPAHQESHRPPKVSAQSLFSQRPGPPSLPTTSKSKADTPGTGALSSDSHSAAHNRAEEQQQPQKEQPTVDNETPTEESSPADTPNESPATDTVVASSPEPACEASQEVDLAAADIPTLQNMQRAASDKVAFPRNAVSQCSPEPVAYHETPQNNTRWPGTRHSAGFACGRYSNGNH